MRSVCCVFFLGITNKKEKAKMMMKKQKKKWLKVKINV